MRSGHGETIEIDDVAPGRSGDIIYSELERYQAIDTLSCQPFWDVKT